MGWLRFSAKYAAIGLLIAGVLGCASGEDADDQTDGSTSSAGSTGSGGASSSSGAMGSGGTASAGGTTGRNSGGTTSVAGATGRGGFPYETGGSGSSATGGMAGSTGDGGPPTSGGTSGQTGADGGPGTGGNTDGGIVTDGAVRTDRGTITDGVVGADGGTTDGTAPSGLWSMGYYASWQPDQYPIAEIEWSGLTHIAMAFYMPQWDGAVRLLGGDSRLATDLIAAAHANGVQAIASIGGADSQAKFRQATASGTIAYFASSLLALLYAGYDGIDIDWEPMDKTDEAAVVEIAKRIRTRRPNAVLTIPVGAINVNIPPDLSGFAAIAEVYDQLNIMSYGQAGAWPGWKSWHSSALYHTDSATPTSIDSTVKLYLDAKVPAAKLGIGIGFYGLCYSPPISGPEQMLGSATLIASDGDISYANIMANYWSESARKWDDLAKVPYLSFASAQPPDGCSYISYDDEQSIGEKAAYAKAKGLGGVIMWELNEAYLKTEPAGQRNPLLKAIASSVLH